MGIARTKVLIVPIEIGTKVGERMLNWIKSLVSGCKHEFKIIDRTSLYWYNYDQYPYGTKYTLQCKKCGIIKVTKT